MLAIVFIYGLVFGSFYNVVGLRLPHNHLFSAKRSYCPKCKKQLSWTELFPLFSYLIQRGRCRTCKQAISFTYPLFECLTGLLFSLAYIQFGFTAPFYFSIFLTSFLIILTISDLHYYIIPNKLYLVFGLPLIFLSHLINPMSFLYRLFSVVIIAIVFTFILFLFENGLGMGDIKLFLFLTYLFGLEIILYCIILSSLLSILYFMFRYFYKNKNLSTKIPFGPFISLSILLLNYLNF